MVKLTQQRRMKGSQGAWKEFLVVYDKELGISVSDPAKRSVETLVDFVKTFTKEEDIKMFEKLLECHSNRELASKVPDGESPEQSLVRLTVTHPRFSIDYSFPTHEEGWVVMNPKKVKANEMVAVDCAMVLCEDGTEALVKVSIVDRNLQARLDKLVNPEKPVIDYRTQITGIRAKDLKGVSFSMADVQNSLKQILSHETILIGHGLNNYLKALKLEHARVIDTSYIFKYADETISKKPSLDSVCQFVLGCQVRNPGAPHNCLDDARAAMKIVLTKIKHGLDGHIPLVQKDKPLVPGTELPKLFIHKIPDYVTTEDLYRVIPSDHKLEIEPRNSFENYYAVATFKSWEDADRAFETLPDHQQRHEVLYEAKYLILLDQVFWLGEVNDSSGRPQKVVNIRCASKKRCSIRVQKMALDSTSQGLSKKRVVQYSQAISNDSKKLKTG